MVVGLARKSGWVEQFTRAEPTGYPGFPTRQVGLWFLARGAGRLEMPVDLHVMAVRRGLSHTGLLINSMFCTIQYQFCCNCSEPMPSLPGDQVSRCSRTLSHFCVVINSNHFYSSGWGFLYFGGHGLSLMGGLGWLETSNRFRVHCCLIWSMCIHYRTALSQASKTREGMSTKTCLNSI